MSERFAARLAGALFLLVIAVVLASSAAAGGDAGGIAQRLASIAEDPSGLRLSIVLLTVAGIATLGLGAMLHAITRRQDPSLAAFALACRAVESGLYAVQILGAMLLLSLSRQNTDRVRELGAATVDVAAWSNNVGACFFAVGSAVFAYILLRSRAVPRPLAILGLLASLLLAVSIPFQSAAGAVTTEGAGILLWLPMFAFELTAGGWLLIKGLRSTDPVRSPSANAKRSAETKTAHNKLGLDRSAGGSSR
ncbi:DUF4386 domain-containing protein [Salinispora tropica]|uniref:DUF4386 domain-containing protein n=1 Tax=Salinispora tropica (strain ATCC BAA-916 / DSM 44818 / JCM 13857 / NBRC 105044 / CNB-440) TaxID=369723 RepID=A4X276_SALTO|nr:DUF4386 domain-containing protein [Salinispora tropica]ABP52976.1 hypothetical protein Strop_0491 [Salinispora tropica CNB-440]